MTEIFPEFVSTSTRAIVRPASIVARTNRRASVRRKRLGLRSRGGFVALFCWFDFAFISLAPVRGDFFQAVLDMEGPTKDLAQLHPFVQASDFPLLVIRGSIGSPLAFQSRAGP
jgi:hypothetical protein